MEWGIPTTESLKRVMELKADLKIIASGGIRRGLDVAKSIALGADIAGMALPLLRVSADSLNKADCLIDEIIMGLKIAMFGIGATDISRLKNTKYLVKNQSDK